MASIKKISERKFKITISNGYRPNGQKICKSKTVTVPSEIPKRRISQYITHEAEELERIVKLGYREDGEMTFEEYARLWIARQTKYAPGTLSLYQRSLEQVYPLIGKIKLNALRPVALENMLVELRKRRYRGRLIAEVTVQKYLTAVSAVLSDAKRNEIIPKNPARMVSLPNTTQPSQNIPTEEEAKRFLDVLAMEPDVYRVYYALAIFTGCRRGELCALKWSDVTAVGYEGILNIRRSRSTVPGRGVTEGPTKNRKARTIYLSAPVMGLLRMLYFQTPVGEDGLPLQEYIFINEKEQPFHPDTFSKHLRKLLDENEFPRSFHLHTLRHYFVSTLLHNGVDKQTVAELAGHGDTSFLERTYCHPQMNLKRIAAEQLVTSLTGISPVNPTVNSSAL